MPKATSGRRADLAREDEALPEVDHREGPTGPKAALFLTALICAALQRQVIYRVA